MSDRDTTCEKIQELLEATRWVSSQRRRREVRGAPAHVRRLP